MQNMATLYKITKALDGGFKNCDIPMKDADGVVITSVEKQTLLWKTHFETILNKEAPREVEDIPERDEDLLVNMDPPTANKVKSAIDNMKSEKASGADGVSAEIINMLYEGFKSKVICGQHLTEEFDIKTGVKQWCILSPFVFCLTIDWIMKSTYIGVKSGIIWAFTESLGYLDSAEDIYLLAHSHRDAQSIHEKLVRNAAKVGLHVNKDKTKTIRNNCQTADSVKLGEQNIEYVIVHIPGSKSDK